MVLVPAKPLWMFAGNEFADRLAAKGADAHQHSEWTVKKIVGVRKLAVQPWRCGAGVPPSPCTWYPNKSILVSHVTVPRKRVSLEERVGLSAHETVAGRRAGSVKCMKCVQVCGKKDLRVWLPTTCIPWQAKDALPSSSTREDEPQNHAWQAAFENGDEVERSAVHPRLEATSVHMGHRIFHHRGVVVCVTCGRYSMWVNRKLRRDCPGKPSRPRVASLLSSLRRVPGWLWRLSGLGPPCTLPAGEHGPFLLVERRCPWERRVGVLSSSFCSAVLV